MADPKKDEDDAAELLAFALGARPERVTDAMVARQPAHVRAELGVVHDTLAALALDAEPVAPSPELRDRLMQTIVQRRRAVRAAILVVDMVNDHLRPGAALEVPRARAIVPALRERLMRARGEGVPVIYVVDEHSADDADLDFVEGWGAHNIAGTDGAEVWAELAPEPGDRIVKKPTYSAFTGSTLDALLGDLRVDSLVLTGCLTEIGLMATAKDALERGYAVDVPPDAQAGSHPDLERSTLATLAAMVPYGAARQALLSKIDAR